MRKEESPINILKKYKNFNSEAEQAYDNFAKLAAQICDTSSAQINFFDTTRQWSKANIGFGSPENPLETSFCIHAVQSDASFMVVPDAKKDKRFKDNPLTNSDPALSFYASATIKDHNDYPIGTICVLDSEPKEISEKQIEALQMLAKEVETHNRLVASSSLARPKIIERV